MSNLKQHLPCFMFMFFINFYIKLFFSMLLVSRVQNSCFVQITDQGSTSHSSTDVFTDFYVIYKASNRHNFINSAHFLCHSMSVLKVNIIMFAQYFSAHLRSTRSQVWMRAGGTPWVRENLRFWRWILMGPGPSLAFLGAVTRCTGNCWPSSNWLLSRT